MKSVPPRAKILTISELTRQVKSLIEEGFPSVCVSGEVSNLKKHSSGIWYLSLKDSRSQLTAVIFRDVNQRLRHDLGNGLKVIAFGRLTVYEPYGSYRLLVDRIQPDGIGPLELALRQRREKLAALGYFDPARKRPLPRFPSRLVLITSPTGAAVRDMLEVITRRWPMVEVWVCPVPVQGDGAAKRIAAAIQGLNRLRGIDLLVLGRGGGSLEDLWEFNEECVAEAIFRSRIPVVTGIGHETDLTIADQVADERGLTPTQAATLAVPDRAALLEGLSGLAGRLHTTLGRRLEAARGRLHELGRRPSLRRPLQRIRDSEQGLDSWTDRLQRAAGLRFERARQRLERLAAQLEGLSPLNVLARGYSLTRLQADRGVVRSAAQVRPGDRLVTLLHNGSIVSRVESSTSGETQGG